MYARQKIRANLYHPDALAGRDIKNIAARIRRQSIGHGKEAIGALSLSANASPVGISWAFRPTQSSRHAGSKHDFVKVATNLPQTGNWYETAAVMNDAGAYIDMKRCRRFTDTPLAHAAHCTLRRDAGYDQSMIL